MKGVALRNSRGLSFLLLAMIYFLPRAPFFGRPLVGEEGIFADLFVNHSQGSLMALMGRIQGQDFRQMLGHPAMLYKSLGWLGSLLEGPWRACLGADWHPVWVLRLSFSLYQFAAWTILVLWLAPALWARPWSWLLLAAMIDAPLALGGSLYLQTDPTNGALLAALVGMALTVTLKGGSGLPLALTCILLGFGGKQEWSLGIALGFAAAVAWGGMQRSEWMLWGLCIAGLMLGNMASYLVQPEDYMGGLDLMMRMGRNNNAITGSKRVLAGAMLVRGHFLVALGFAWLALARILQLAPAPSRRGLRWCLGASLALSLPYMATAWGTDYRYFIPPFMVAVPVLFAAACLNESGEEFWKWARFSTLLLGLHAVLFWSDAWLRNYSITERSFLHYDAYLAGAKARERQGCVAWEPSGLYWDRRDQDWVGSSMAPEDVANIAARYKAKACLD